MWKLSLVFALAASAAVAEERSVFLEDNAGTRIRIATLDLAADDTYSVRLDETAFTNHFLSMRPFKCLEGPEKHWCHVPYPYEIRRDLSADLTDLEYDFLFLWKGATDYGIDAWNGVYYKLEEDGAQLAGTLHELDLGQLAVPPAAGELRPIAEKDLHEAEPESHWLPRLIVE